MSSREYWTTRISIYVKLGLSIQVRSDHSTWEAAKHHPLSDWAAEESRHSSLDKTSNSALVLRDNRF